MSEWQPIETAPKDGTSILACGFYNYKRQDYDNDYEWIADIYLDEKGRWWFLSFDIHEDDYLRPTHWMPLPTPPDSTERK